VFNYYRQFIDEERIKIVWFEEFIQNTVDTFQDICRFLDIDDTIIIQADKRHQSSREQVLSNSGDQLINTSRETEVRTWALNQIRDDNSRFLDYFGKPPDYWVI
jgi:hypothetical protein